MSLKTLDKIKVDAEKFAGELHEALTCRWIFNLIMYAQKTRVNIQY